MDEPAGCVREVKMGLFRTSRAMTVAARQFTEAATIATDLGFVNVKRGEWVVNGENGECYVVDDAFFQRTFVAIAVDADNSLRTGRDHRIRIRQSDRARQTQGLAPQEAERSWSEARSSARRLHES
jgi:hypothetical protein